MMSNKRIEDINITQKSVNDFLNSLEGKRVLMNLKYLIKGYKPIKRTRKQQIAKAKHMLAWHDHTSYEWSQWWHKTARKPKRWKK